MFQPPTSWIRRSLRLGAIAVAASSLGAETAPARPPQTPPARPQASRPAPPADTIVAQVRTAIGRGAIEGARRLVETSDSPVLSKAMASALIDIFEGKDEDARLKLLPMVASTPYGDAALELGLWHRRHGRRDEARRLLEAINDSLYNRASQGAALAEDDYFRLARAAESLGRIQLANDAFQRIKGARADVQTAWGDMFLSRHKPALAAESYRAALAADPAWVRAHLGLARAFGTDDPASAGKAFEAAQKLAPNHPDVHLLLAERALEQEDRAAAAEALDRLGKVRTASIDEAALRVAIAFASRIPADVVAALKRVDEIDPRSARGFRAAGQQAAQEYRFDDAAAFALQAVTRDPDDPVAHAEQGLYLLRTGDEKTARTALETSWAMDNSDPVTKNLLDLLDTLDTFKVVPDGDFIYKFPKEDAAALEPYALPLGRLALKTFGERYGFTPKGPILVEMFSKHDDFAVRTVGLMGITGALGACFGRVVTMDTPRARRPGEYSWQATQWHELAHVFSLQMSDYRVPRWLTEGISVFEEFRHNPAWGRELTLEYAAALGAGKTFGVKGLPKAFKNPENFALAYFEASLVVEHLVSLAGDAGLRTLLKAYGDGATDTDAFARAFNRDIDAVEATFKTFVEGRYAALRDALKPPPSQVDPEDMAGLRARASAAPANFVSQMSLGQALFAAGDLSGARAPLERAAQLAPQAAGARSPRALLAQIAEKDGDPTRARREWRALLTWDHTNVHAARRLAALAADAKAHDDLDYALRIVTDLDPFDTEAHTVLGRRLLTKSEYAAALVEFQAALALSPANLAEAHADAAEALLKLGRRDEARKAALLALKDAPTFARAQDILLAAMGRDRQ